MEWYGYVLLVAGLLIVAFIFFLIGMLYRKKVAEREIGSAETEATRIINEAIKGGENKKREMLVEAKEEIHKSRTEYEKEVKERRADLQKQERRLQQKEESLDKKLDAFERKEDDLRRRQANIAATQDEVEMIKKSQLETLEKLSGLTQEEAKNHLLKNLENECKHDAALKIKEIETNLKDNADQLAREIISIAIQRCAADRTYTKLYVLASAVEEPRTAEFRVGDRTYEAEVPLWKGFYGQWGWYGNSEGFMQRAKIGYLGTHRHQTDLGNVPYGFSYMYLLTFDIPEGATTVTLPRDKKVLVYAMTASNNPIDDVKLASRTFVRPDER